MTCYLSNNDVDVIKWHARLGHIGKDWMNRMVKEGHLSSFTKIDKPTCETILLKRLHVNHMGRLKDLSSHFK